MRQETGGTASGGSAHEGIKDTIESIVVALILAFVFRAFVVEAFVIPTGSMAPTLYGAHGTIVCEDCGMEFAYGLRDLGDLRPMAVVTNSAYATCPNCSHNNTALKVNDESRNPETGDRILVLKWPFDIGGPLLSPARWDVTVFKDPSDGTTNFIKRLVGMPNEVLMIVDGDVYTVPTERLSAETLKELDDIRHEKYEYQAGIRTGGALRSISEKVRRELEEKLSIARKTPQAQRSLWMTVYDHDYKPRSPDRNQPHWAAEAGDASGWDATTHRVRFADRGVTSDSIMLGGKPILATNAYNIFSRTPPPVSDQRVRFVLTPTSSIGTLRIRLEKLGRAFWATVNLDGAVNLTESRDAPTDATPLMASARLEPFLAGQSIEVSFENLDYRLALRVGGNEVLTSSSIAGDPSYYGPNLKALRQLCQPIPLIPPRLYGAGGSFALTHLAVERDEYYYHDPAYSALALSWGPRGGWASPECPILLRGHEYFMLGDNTSASKDSRLWDMPNTADERQITPWAAHLRSLGEDFQLGTVARDQLIGKAFFVYWPSPHRLDWIPRFTYGVVPDVGRMRWIR